MENAGKVNDMCYQSNSIMTYKILAIFHSHSETKKKVQYNENNRNKLLLSTNTNNPSNVIPFIGSSILIKVFIVQMNEWIKHCSMITYAFIIINGITYNIFVVIIITSWAKIKESFAYL